jgi:hypothetical protein
MYSLSGCRPVPRVVAHSGKESLLERCTARPMPTPGLERERVCSAPVVLQSYTFRATIPEHPLTCIHKSIPRSYATPLSVVLTSVDIVIPTASKARTIVHNVLQRVLLEGSPQDTRSMEQILKDRLWKPMWHHVRSTIDRYPGIREQPLENPHCQPLRLSENLTRLRRLSSICYSLCVYRPFKPWIGTLLRFIANG